MKFMTKEAASYGLNGHGAAHHPTRAFHMLRGEAISWLYTLAALDAIYMLENDLKTSSPSVLSARYQAKLAQLQVSNRLLNYAYHTLQTNVTC